MSLRTSPIYRKLCLLLFLFMLSLTDFTGKILFKSNGPLIIEFNLLKFIGRVKFYDKNININNSRKDCRQNDMENSSHVLTYNINSSNASNCIDLRNKVLLKTNITIPEIPIAKTEHHDNYFSLLPLLLGKERLNLVELTIQNELKLYNHLKAFPRKIFDYDKYIQLYTICSYLSPLVFCEIKEISKYNEVLFNKTSNLSNSSNIIEYLNPKSNKDLKYLDITFPYIFSNHSYKWNVISGEYGDVICGKIFGGIKNLFPHHQESSSFFFSTYKNFKSKEYITYVSDSETFEINPLYKQLDEGKSIHICIKSFRSANHPLYFTIWNDENFNIKWLERETWLSHFYNVKNYIKFTPRQVFIAPRKLKSSNIQKGNTLSIQFSEKFSHNCVKKCENSIFYPSVYESHYPWSVLGKFWSSYLIMERFVGPSFSEISNFLVSDSVINWIKLSKGNFYLWSASLIHIAYLYFSALISFTFTGSLLYQHCDLHANNLIFQSKNWNIVQDDSYSQPKFQISIQKVISEIVSSNLTNVKIIDLTFVTYFNAKRRSSNLVCETFGEVSISDIENWQIFVYNFKNDVEKAFSKHSDLAEYVNPLSELIKLFESDIDFNLTKPKYVGGSELWWENWTFNQNKFDDLYNSVLGIGSLFSKAITLVESSIFQNNNIPLLNTFKVPYSKVLINPILFEAYLKELFYVPYSVLSFGSCVYKYEVIYKKQTYFLTAAETLSHYMLIYLQFETDQLPSWIHKEQVGSKLLWNQCLKSNPSFSKAISENFPREFYFEPCFEEFCVSKKMFPDKIQLWIKEDIQDRNSFFNSCKSLISSSLNKVDFALSILVLNQIKFNVKQNLIDSSEKLYRPTLAFSNSISSHLINQIHQEKLTTQEIHLFLSFCIEEYYKHLLLFISPSTFNFGEKLCSLIYKAIFTKFTIS